MALPAVSGVSAARSARVAVTIGHPQAWNPKFAAISNGGAAPQFQWTVNGAPVGGNSATYSAASLQLGDEVACTLISDADCADPTDALSNTIIVDCGQALGELIFSEYVEGSANNKALEIYNPTLAAVDLADYVVALYINGAVAPSQSLQLSGILPSGGVYVVANSSASAAVLAVADITSAVCTFNGDDAVALLYQGFPSDVIGVIGVDPGAFWDIPTGGETAEYTLRRVSTVTAPENDWTIAQFQWNDFAQNDFTDLGDGLPTSLTDATEEAPLLVPNPTREGFRVVSDGPVRVRIRSLAGQLIADHATEGAATFIPTNALASGVYVVEVDDRNAIQRTRLVVE